TIPCPVPDRTFSQTPDRSGFPSVVLGVGASSFTFPSGVRGAPAAGYKGHCADSDGEMTATMNTQAAPNRIFIFTSRISTPIWNLVLNSRARDPTACRENPQRPPLIAPSPPHQ